MTTALEVRRERLRNLAARLNARAAVQRRLTPRPRRAASPRFETARLLASRRAAAGPRFQSRDKPVALARTMFNVRLEEVTGGPHLADLTETVRSQSLLFVQTR